MARGLICTVNPELPLLSSSSSSVRYNEWNFINSLAVIDPVVPRICDDVSTGYIGSSYNIGSDVVGNSIIR